MSDWAVFWSGVGGVLAGAIVGVVASFLIARYTLLRTRADDKQLAREERNEDAARRITEAFIDLQEALRWDREEQIGPLDWFATVNQAVESLVRVSKLDIPILASPSMGRRIFSARKSAQATRDWMLPEIERFDRGLVTEDELGQEFLEVLSARPLYDIVVTLISDIDVYRNSGEEPTREQTVVTPPIPKYVKELERLFPTQAKAAPVQQMDEPTGCLEARSADSGHLLHSWSDKVCLASGYSSVSLVSATFCYADGTWTPGAAVSTRLRRRYVVTSVNCSNRRSSTRLVHAWSTG